MSQSVKGQKNHKKAGEKVADDEDELFMAISPQEKAAWEKMMKSRIASLKKNHVEFKNWQDNMTRRRMFVYSRMRKLHASQMDRFRFVLKMAETMKNAKDNKDDNNNTENDDKENNPATNAVNQNNETLNTLNTEENDNVYSNTSNKDGSSHPSDQNVSSLDENGYERASVNLNTQDQTTSTTIDNNVPTILVEDVTNY